MLRQRLLVLRVCSGLVSAAQSAAGPWDSPRQSAATWKWSGLTSSRRSLRVVMAEVRGPAFLSDLIISHLAAGGGSSQLSAIRSQSSANRSRAARVCSISVACAASKQVLARRRYSPPLLITIRPRSTLQTRAQWPPSSLDYPAGARNRKMARGATWRGQARRHTMQCNRVRSPRAFPTGWQPNKPAPYSSNSSRSSPRTTTGSRLPASVYGLDACPRRIRKSSQKWSGAGSLVRCRHEETAPGLSWRRGAVHRPAARSRAASRRPARPSLGLAPDGCGVEPVEGAAGFAVVNSAGGCAAGFGAGLVAD
jgi:hypothetical protein